MEKILLKNEEDLKDVSFLLKLHKRAISFNALLVFWLLIIGKILFVVLYFLDSNPYSL